MPTLNRIAPAQLFRLIGSADCPALIDVRTQDDAANDPFLIPTARRHPHERIEEQVPALEGRRVVVICARGLKLSEGAAALLRLHGIAAEVLDGGSEGWREAGLPRVPVGLVPPNGLWVTRHRPKVDRIACPWLIRRFVDPTARFLFVAPSEVLGVAAASRPHPLMSKACSGAIAASAAPSTRWCRSSALVSRRWSVWPRVVRAADTDRHDLAPQAAGLLAISVGLSRLYKDDLAATRGRPGALRCALPLGARRVRRGP